MSSRRPPRRWPATTLATCGLLAGLLVGCAPEQEPAPSGADSPGSTDPSPSAPAPTGDIVGPPTSSQDHPEWEPIEGLYMPRDDFGTAVIGSEVWALGGMTGERGNRLLSIEVMDTATEEWETSDIEMPIGVASFETVALGPRIYAFGGLDADNHAVRFAAVLDTRTGRWQQLPRLPHNRYAHTVTAFDGRIYVIGGRDDQGRVAEVDVFDPEREQWSTAKSSMRRLRDSHKTVATPDGLMVVGGWRGSGPTDAVDLYDPRTDTWSAGPTLPKPVSRAGVVNTGEEVWVSYHELSYVLDLETMQWEEANALPLYRHGLGYVHVGGPGEGTVYAIGGCALNPLRDVRDVDKIALG